MSSLPCYHYHPAEVEQLYQSFFNCLFCFRPLTAGSAFSSYRFRGHLCVCFRYGLVIRHYPMITLSVGFNILLSLHIATLATGLRLLSWWVYLPLNILAFSGHTVNNNNIYLCWVEKLFYGIINFTDIVLIK